MKLVIDTNIILDVLLEREPFFEDSKAILKMCEEKSIEGFVTASTITDIFYITRKALHSTNSAYKAIEHMLNIVKVLSVTNADVNEAFLQKAQDFEDCLLATCAKSNKCDGIVTRNIKDFLSFNIALIDPKSLIE